LKKLAKESDHKSSPKNR